jgi:hypothetical protein
LIFCYNFIGRFDKTKPGTNKDTVTLFIGRSEDGKRAEAKQFFSTTLKQKEAKFSGV